MAKGKKEVKALKKIVLEKAKINAGTSASNIKLGEMGSWGMLFGNAEWYVPELGISCPGTCGNHCKGCYKKDGKSPCYVEKSYRKYTKRNEDGTVGDIYTNACSVKLGHAYRTLAMTHFRSELLDSLDGQLTRRKQKFDKVRINESGELTCYEDLELWCILAKRHPETVFYLYTKNYKAVRTAIQMDIVPSNMFINISIWHKQGIAEYLEFSSHPQIKAFVLVDDKWTVNKYASHGLIITSMCGAYDERGKMNHTVTCDKCNVCMSNRVKVVGCFEH